VSAAAARLATAARALGVDASEAICARIVAYLDAMLEANRALNLTAIREREPALVLHALDSLAVALVAPAPARALDLGSGNGFPGVAIAALWPQAEVVLVERTTKKARALERLIAAAGFASVAVAHVDAAQIAAVRPELCGADLVAARAVGTPAAVAALAAPLLAARRRLVLWLDAATPAPTRLRGFDDPREITYELPEPAPRRRRLAVYRRRG
jgi:16S rRNA (guanine527-N7)-methyltransferase